MPMRGRVGTSAKRAAVTCRSAPTRRALRVIVWGTLVPTPPLDVAAAGTLRAPPNSNLSSSSSFRSCRAWHWRRTWLTSWLEVTQRDVDAFGRSVQDWHWAHNDPERATGGPVGGPIAHAHMTLALAPHFREELVSFASGECMCYGYNRVRFPTDERTDACLQPGSPVPSPRTRTRASYRHLRDAPGLRGVHDSVTGRSE